MAGKNGGIMEPGRNMEAGKSRLKFSQDTNHLIKPEYGGGKVTISTAVYFFWR